jgi:hypothetical protein
MAVDKFIYPYSVTIKRQAAVAVVGETKTYGGVQAATETTVVEDLPANIEYYSTSIPNESGMPGNSYGRGRYRVFIPIEYGGVRSIGVQKSDTVIDDDGNRYQIHSAYWNSLGYAIHADLIEV